MEKIIRIDSASEIQEIVGAQNNNVKTIENYLDVIIEPNIAGIKIVSEKEQEIELATQIIEKISNLSKNGFQVTEQLTNYLSNIGTSKNDKLKNFQPDCLTLNAKGKPVVSKTLGQSEYINAMKNNKITFAIGPAGTGKTYLAVAMAVQAFKQEEVDRIILTRPAVEAGERLGFLPGDLQSKVDPYMRPLYDALQDLLGYDAYTLHMQRGLIEVSPLAYMRGRTLDNAFVILDEAQNTTPEQMKMFLTRLGFDSKIVVTGDDTQIDLLENQRSGLIDAADILKDVKDLAIVHLDDSDVVRNTMVQRIIKAYEKHDKNKKNYRARSGSARSGNYRGESTKLNNRNSK